MEQPDLLKCVCADCGEIMTYPPAKSGQIIKCPKCGVKSQLPAAPLDPADNDSDSSGELDPAPPKTCPVCGERLGRFGASCATCEGRRRRKRTTLIWTAGGLAGLLVIVAVLWTIRGRPQKPAANPIPPDGTWLPQPKVKTAKSLDDLKVGKFYVTWPRGGDVGIVSGDIENVSENLHRDVRVTLELLDRQGAKIGNVDDFVTELPARRIWHVGARTSQTNAMSVRFGSIKEAP